MSQSKFLLGFLSGAIVGCVAAFAKNPLTSNSVKEDIKNATDNLSDSYNDVRATYSSLQQERNSAAENDDPEVDDEVQVNPGSIKDKATDLVTAVKSVAKKNDDLNDLADRVQDLKDTAEIKKYEMQDEVNDRVADLKDKVNNYKHELADEENEFVQSTTPEEKADAQEKQSDLADHNDFVIDDADKD